MLPRADCDLQKKTLGLLYSIADMQSKNTRDIFENYSVGTESKKNWSLKT